MKPHRMFFRASTLPQHPAVSTLLLALLLAMAASIAPAAHAASTISVTTTADESDAGSCGTFTDNPGPDGVWSLREAICATNNVAGADTINITATGTISLTSILPTIQDSLTIIGPGASSLTVSGENRWRVFHVWMGCETFSFQNMTIANGKADFGAGIRINGALAVSVNQVTFSGNVGTNSGSAIYNASGNSLTVTKSTFVNNVGFGGAVSNDGPSTLIVADSTFSGNNHSGYSAGSIAQISTGSTFLTNATISASDEGSAVYVSAGTLTLQNSIIANSLGSSCEVAGGTMTNGGNNIDLGTSCGFDSTSGSMSNTDPKLGSLGDNGGATQTMALLANSPAVNAGNATVCAAAVGSPTFGAGGVDGRGLPRRSGVCDTGAFEAQPASLRVVAGSSPQNALVNTAFPLPLNAHAADANSNALAGVVVTYAAPASGPSANLSATTATSNTNGNAWVAATANGTFGGPYNVTATVSGLTPINFALTNNPLQVFLPSIRR